MMIAGVVLLTVYSLLPCVRTHRWKMISILSGLTVLGCIAGYLWYPQMCFYIVLFNVVVQSLYYARMQGDSIYSGLLQCIMYILLSVTGSVLLLVLIFIAVQIREEMVLRRYENYSVNYQNKLLKNQVEEVQHIYMTMRGWRHDYHNHLQSLKVKLNQNQIQEAVQYLDELEQDLDDIHQIVESGNVNVDAILNSKLSLAIAQQIDVNVKVVIPKTLPLSDIDCCVLLGNLIDNAIEACNKVEENKFIRLYIGIHKKQLYMSITNATNEVVRKFDEEYITTKRGNHGHGLKRINKVVEKYNGYINRKNEPGVFVCEIMLPI